MARRLDEEPRKSNVSNELIASFGIEVEQAQREIDEATGRKRSVLKRAKESGLNTKQLLAAISLKKQDADTMIQDERDRLRYARVIAPAGPWTQEDLFGGLDLKPLSRKAQSAQNEWEWEREGYRAGLDGRDKSDNPHVQGAPAHVKWLAGWQRGQLQLATSGDDGGKVASLARRKPRTGKDAAAEQGAEDREQTDLEDFTPPTSTLLDGEPAGAA